MAAYWYLFVVVGCILEAVFICYEYAKKPVAAVILKGAASALFVLLGFVCMSASADARFALLVVIGLVFGATGDVLLNLRALAGNAGQKVFMAGIAAFLTGHLLYITALISRGADALWIGVPVCAALSVTLLPFFILRRIEVTGKLKTFGIVYVALVFLMAGCAAGLLILKPFNGGHLLFAIGAALFALSDVILIFHLLGRKKHKAFRALNLSAYYIGQILIALSLLYI
jgi:uncharacterized membrane protein YhhN